MWSSSVSVTVSLSNVLKQGNLEGKLPRELGKGWGLDPHQAPVVMPHSPRHLCWYMASMKPLQAVTYLVSFASLALHESLVRSQRCYQVVPQLFLDFCRKHGVGGTKESTFSSPTTHELPFAPCKCNSAELQPHPSCKQKPSSEAAPGGEFGGVSQPGGAGESQKPHVALDGSYLTAHVVCFPAESVIQHLQALNAERPR